MSIIFGNQMKPAFWSVSYSFMVGCDDGYWLAAIELSIAAVITLLVAVHRVHNVYDSIKMMGKIEAMLTKRWHKGWLSPCIHLQKHRQ